jgi:hypothetical protein
MANNLHIIPVAEEVQGSYCNTDSGRHVDVVDGLGAAIATNHAIERGDEVWDWDDKPQTFDSTHGTFLTTPASNGYDTHSPAQHTVGGQ